MPSEFSQATPLRMLPFQVVELADGVIVRRGCSEFKILGPDASLAITALRRILQQPRTVEEIIGFFPTEHAPAIHRLLERLLAHRFLIYFTGDKEDNRDRNFEEAVEVFDWHFGDRESPPSSSLKQKRIAVFGVNTISQRIAELFAELEIVNAVIVDHPSLRNLRMFDSEESLDRHRWRSTLVPLAYDQWNANAPLDCLIATSDFGGLQLMREWNNYCLRRNIVFLPCVLQSMIGYAGPLVIPGETPCFECLRARQNANLTSPADYRATEYHATEGQFVVGYHPIMSATLADIAMFELTKFFAQLYPVTKIGHIIEINLLASSMRARKVLRIPRCPSCSSLLRVPSMSLKKELFVGLSDS